MVGPISYIGGKNRLAKRIIALLPEHATYVEAFAGGAQVLFHKLPSNVEVLNDLDYEVLISSVFASGTTRNLFATCDSASPAANCTSFT
jgi:site-specific DNA-adenine methylase